MTRITWAATGAGATHPGSKSLAQPDATTTLRVRPPACRLLHHRGRGRGRVTGSSGAPRDEAGIGRVASAIAKKAPANVGGRGMAGAAVPGAAPRRMVSPSEPGRSGSASCRRICHGDIVLRGSAARHVAAINDRVVPQDLPDKDDRAALHACSRSPLAKSFSKRAQRRKKDPRCVNTRDLRKL